MKFCATLLATCPMEAAVSSEFSVLFSAIDLLACESNTNHSSFSVIQKNVFQSQRQQMEREKKKKEKKT